jgi:type I restriction enzyme S subunit
MVVENGFKQTELGAIPENWEIAFLDDLIDKTRSIRYGIVQPGKFDSNGRYLVRGQDYSFGWADPYTLFRVSPSIEEKYKNARLKSGDLVLTIVGASTGHVESVPNWLDGANITQTTARIPIDDSKANSEFCKQYLQSNYGWKIVLNFMKGAAQPGLNIGDIRIFKIITPPLQEQTAIANALSDMDALISQTEKLIEKKKAIKQGAMQELLKPKDGWVTNKLGNVVEKITTGKLDANAMKSDGDYRFYTCAKEYYYIDKYAFDDEALLISGNGANVGYIHYYKGKFNAYQRTYVLTGFEINIAFIKVYLDKYLSDRIATEVSAGNTPYIKMDTISEMNICYPEQKEQRESIASIINDLTCEFDKLQFKLTKLKQQKQGMMQALLTGKIRLI